MIDQVKRHWDAQFKLSANASFAQFLYNLSLGGGQSMDFIESNVLMVDMVSGNVGLIKGKIESDTEAIENQRYFFSQAMRDLQRVKNVLLLKYAETLPLIQALGLYTEDMNAENFFNELEKAAETPAETIEDILKEANEMKQEGSTDVEIWTTFKYRLKAVKTTKSAFFESLI